MGDNIPAIEWKRTEEFIHGNYYPRLEAATEDWCYSIYPIVRPKHPIAVGFHIGGWARKPGTPDRMRITAEAKTMDECKGICSGHMLSVREVR